MPDDFNLDLSVRVNIVLNAVTGNIRAHGIAMLVRNAGIDIGPIDNHGDERHGIAVTRWHHVVGGKDDGSGINGAEIIRIAFQAERIKVISETSRHKGW